MNIDYRVDRGGRITCWQGTKRLSEPFGELRFAQGKRKALELDPVRVRAAWAIFGRRPTPNDMNELLPFREALQQVDADAPQLLGLAFWFIRKGYLTPKPTISLVQRLKALLTRSTVTPKDIVNWRSRFRKRADQLTKAEFDPYLYWESSYNRDALTEAGWRYLTRLPLEALRSLTAEMWSFKDRIWTLNHLAKAQVAPVTGFEYALVKRCLQLLANDDDSLHHFLLAFRDAKNAGHVFTTEEEDYLCDLFQTDEGRRIAPGRSWRNMVFDAQEFMAKTALLRSDELKAYTWHVPLEKFTSAGGVEVRVLANGPELLEEGIEMKNCLRKLMHYVQRAAQGTSFVAALRGAASGTGEVTRHQDGHWEIAQAAKPCNVKVHEGLLWTATAELAHRLNVQEALARQAQRSNAQLAMPEVQ